MIEFPSSSRSTPAPRGSTDKEQIRLKLVDEARLKSRQLGGLSDELKSALETLSKEDLREVVNACDTYKCTPLFHAARMGNLDVAQYLVEHCGADLEARGHTDGFGDSRPHIVTPLWVASVYGGLTMVKYLLSKGAKINATSNTRSTSIRSACFMSNKLVIETLIEAGADIHITNAYGGSCLTNSVQSIDICQLLLDNGANVDNQDFEGNTALHYAIMERRLDAAKILASNGANIYLPNMAGLSSLGLAAYKGDRPIFEYLQTVTEPSKADEADMWELLGANLHKRESDTGLTQFLKAATIREEYSIPKPKLGYCPPYARTIDPMTGQDLGGVSEHSTVAEWEALQNTELNRGRHQANQNRLKIQALLIKERLLGIYHKGFLKQLRDTGRDALSHRNYFAALEIGSYVLRLQYIKHPDGFLNNNTATALEGLVSTYTSWIKHNQQQQGNGYDTVLCPFDLYMTTVHFLMENLPELRHQVGNEGLKTNPRKCYDLFLVSCVQLLKCMFYDPRTRAELKEIQKVVGFLAKLARPAFTTGDTLLHLVLRRFGGYSGPTVPLNLRLVQTLIHYKEEDVTSVNHFGETPAHILLKNEKYSEDDIAEVLVLANTHLDSYDMDNFMPQTTLLKKPYPGFPTQAPIVLKCIAAKCVGSFDYTWYVSELPAHLVHFVQRHTPVQGCKSNREVVLYDQLSNYDYDDDD